MNSALGLFEDSLDWLNQHYKEYRFFTERDIVWTVQVHLMDAIANSLPSHQVHCNYPVLADQCKCLADVAVLDNTDTVPLAAEFKYEPDQSRDDTLPSKSPVVLWKEGVCQDVARGQRYGANHAAEAVVSVFIDEGSCFRRKDPPRGVIGQIGMTGCLCSFHEHQRHRLHGTCHPRFYRTLYDFA